jgi:hypothetical protein
MAFVTEGESPRRYVKLQANGEEFQGLITSGVICFDHLESLF